MVVVCLGCGRSRPHQGPTHLMPECPICGDVSWTFLEDAQRDTAGVLSCISRREQAALVHDGDGEALLAYELLERARAGSGTS